MKAIDRMKPETILGLFQLLTWQKYKDSCLVKSADSDRRGQISVCAPDLGQPGIKGEKLHLRLDTNSNLQIII